MSERPTPFRPEKIHAWNIWSNPIFRRYCQSRLRVKMLGASMLITILIAGFIVAITTSIGVRSRITPEDAARAAIIPLIIFQGLILFVVGTPQVAGGMVGERDEGVIDYQRLIPMTPLSKVLGYLFGLPVREYVLFLTTLPFTAWVLWRGAVEWRVWLPLYVAMVSSALLYHFTALVTGTVVKNRRWAFLLSIGLVLGLYTVIPQMAKFGLVFFRYLTVLPVFEESLVGILPSGTIKGALQAAQRISPTVKFFNLDFSELVFTLFSQCGLILTFVVMLCRKWRRDESHLLGKLWATGFFVWVQVLLLGNALPLIEPGSLFPSRAFSRFGQFVASWKPAREEALAMSAIYGVVTLVLLWVLSSIITPNRENQVRGWRRARKQGSSSLPVLSDAATAYGFTFVMALAGAAGWFIFTRMLVESHWFPGHSLAPGTLGIFAGVMVAGGMGYQALLEAKGGRSVLFAAILVGAVPILAAMVLGPIREDLLPASVWAAGISPLSLPLYAVSSTLSLADLPPVIARSVPRAFYFWLGVGLLVMVWLSLRLRASRKDIAASVLAEGK